MTALQTIRTAIARQLSTTTALGLLALTLAASGTLVSLQGDAAAPLGGDRLSMRESITVTGDMMLEKDDMLDKNDALEKGDALSKDNEMGVDTL